MSLIEGGIERALVQYRRLVKDRGWNQVRIVAFGLIILAMVGCGGHRSGERISGEEPLPWYLPPVWNADPWTQSLRTVIVPSSISAIRKQDAIVFFFDSTATRPTKVWGGQRMCDGTRVEVYHYTNGTRELVSSRLIASANPLAIEVFSLDSLKYSQLIQEYNSTVVELTLFETDIPPQRFWRPEATSKFQIIWQGRFRLPEIAR